MDEEATIAHDKQKKVFQLLVKTVSKSIESNRFQHEHDNEKKKVFYISEVLNDAYLIDIHIELEYVTLLDIDPTQRFGMSYVRFYITEFETGKTQFSHIGGIEDIFNYKNFLLNKFSMDLIESILEEKLIELS